MANMDYPTSCMTCSQDGVCSLTPEDAIRPTSEDKAKRARFWNHLSDSENSRKVDGEGEWSL